MTLLRREVEANFDAFTADWKRSLPAAISALDPHRDEYLRSYGRIASLNAWRGNLLDGRISEGSLGFFGEAVNDAITAHVQARCGNWRSSLMSLRSCIENTCYCIFYKDHPVELALWELGKHRPGFSEILTYLKSHPDVAPLGNSTVTGIAMLEAEYGTLSRAVHASARGFRMSPDNQRTELWKPEVALLGQWKTREIHTMNGLNLLLITIFRELLHGAQQIGLRKALSFTISAAQFPKIKSELHVTIIAA